MTRRALLVGGAGVLGLGAVGAAGWTVAPYRLKASLGLTPDPFIPDAAEGQVRVETVRSAAMGGAIDLFTTVPAGHGDGAGLPVVVVLHGASASAADFRDFGFARFVTAAVQAGAPPFVLAGTDDGPLGWVPDGNGVNPQRMLTAELPQWLGERGFDAGRRAVWGWSRGGYGALRLLKEQPDFARALALFSPAVVEPDLVFEDLGNLGSLPVGIWCGEDDSFIDGVRTLVRELPQPPAVLTYAPGGHTRVFWNDHTLEALGWLAAAL